MVKCHSDSNVHLHARSRWSRERIDAALKAALRAVVRVQHWAIALQSISGRATPSLEREMPARYSSVSRRLDPYRAHRTAGGYPPQPNGRRSHERYRTSPRRIGGRSPLDPNAIWCHRLWMGLLSFRRSVMIFSVLALLLAGFVTTSVAANVPCGMDMAAAGAVPCGDSSMPDGPDKMPGASVCIAKCPVPLLDRAVEPLALVSVESLVPASPLYSVWAGLGIVPPLEPPRA